MIKAIVFDLDDTLYPEKAFQESGFAAVSRHLKEIGFLIEPREISNAYKKHNKNCFDALILKYKLPVDVSYLVSFYRNHYPNINVYPGVHRVLSRLKEKYALGMITDYFCQSQMNKIEALGLSKYFNAVIYTDQLDAPKPLGKSFLAIKNKLDVEDNAIMYIGDNEAKDFIGARSSGFITVRYNNARGFYSKIRLEKKYRADFEITNHSQIFSILNILERKSKKLSNKSFS